MGKSNSLDSVRFYAEATASTLAGLGINVNFAPVVDLAVEVTNPVIYKHGRAFSSNEDSVALLAKEFIKQHRKYGVITSLKHFPGHGSSKQDTHLGIADVTDYWTDKELIPYKTLIDSGYADAVMTSHIVNRNLDKQGRPGTLSFDILNGILRHRLNFNGIVFTDDMQMHAITKHYGLEEAIKLAINAGVDIMTFSNNITGSDERTVDRVHAIIRAMVEKGEIKPERIDASFRRIMKVKSQLKTGDKIASLKKQIASIQAQLDRMLIENQNLIKENKLLKEPMPEPKKPELKKKKKRK
jgi:beta-N-acetylhexosaminidase